MLIKKRVIAYQKSGEAITGFTLPKEINMMVESWRYFNIELSGTSILLTSGTNNKPTQEEKQAYNFAGARV